MPFKRGFGRFPLNLLVFIPTKSNCAQKATTAQIVFIPTKSTCAQKATTAQIGFLAMWRPHDDMQTHASLPHYMRERPARATPLPVGVAPPARRARQAHPRHRRRRRRRRSVLAAAAPGTRCASAVPAAPARPRRRAAVSIVIVRWAGAIAGGRARDAPVARVSARASLGAAVVAGRGPAGAGDAARAARGIIARPIALALPVARQWDSNDLALASSHSRMYAAHCFQTQSPRVKYRDCVHM